MQEYDIIDKKIHQFCQTLAKFGRSFVESKTDDSHTNLRFDFLGKRVLGRWANINGTKINLCFDLEGQKFQLFNQDYCELASFETIGKSYNEVEIIIARYLTDKIGVNGSDFLKSLHFEIPEYDFKNDTIQIWKDVALDQWMNYRHLANLTCGLFQDYLNAESDIRIWPHHFDTGIYTELNKNIGVGFGWAMADSMIDEAYYYFSVYGLNGYNIDYATINPLSIGKWIIGENWNGAVLPLKDAEIANIESFIKETTKWVFS